MIQLSAVRRPFEELVASVRSPQEFFTTPENLISRRAILRMLLLTAALLVPVGIASYIAYRRLAGLAAGASLPQGVTASGVLLDFDLTLALYPLNLLLFPVYWLMLGFYSGVMRYLFLKALGDPVQRLSQPLAISITTATPMILVGALLRIVNYSWPFSSIVDSPVLFSTRVWITGILFFLSWCAEGYLSVQAFRLVFNQNRGRAVMTWLFPTGSLLFLLWLLLYILSASG